MNRRNPSSAAGIHRVVRLGVPNRRWIRFACLSAALSFASGCGYTAGGPFREGIRTVHVETFQTREFRRDLEFALTEAIQKRIAMDSPYRIAPARRADTMLTGEVLEQRNAAFAPDPFSRLPREEQVLLAVRVVWKDLRTGELLLDKDVLIQAADFIEPAGETEAFTQQKVIERLSERIVMNMYDDSWAAPTADEAAAASDTRSGAITSRPERRSTASAQRR